MSFMEYPRPDACRALMPTPDPHPPGPPSRPMVCHMPKGHDGPHALTRRPGPIDRRWEGDAPPVTAGLPDRAADRERECTCCQPGKRPAIEHAKGCPRRAPRSVPLSTSSVGEQLAALAARPAPDDSEVGQWPCVYDYERTQCIREGHDHAAPSSPGSGDALREAVADELARHADTMRWSDNDADPVTVELGCRCGYVRGTVTAKDLAADLDGRMRAHRLHVADAVIAVPELAGPLALSGSRTSEASQDHLRTPDSTREAATEALRAVNDGNGADPTTTEGRR